MGAFLPLEEEAGAIAAASSSDLDFLRPNFGRRFILYFAGSRDRGFKVRAVLDIQ